MPKKAPLSEMMFIRLAPSDIKLIEECEALAPVLPRAQVVRQAVRVGLHLIKADASLLLAEPDRKKRS